MTKSSFVSGALRAAAFAFCALGALSAGGAQAAAVDVTTYHYDNYRTGWNSSETMLTPYNVSHTSSTGRTFELLSSVALDDQVDAQPLVMANQVISGHSARNVVYVATENNSIYAIDTNDGAILRHRNFGTPVPELELPGGCNNNAANVGINGTPVIDSTNGTMYVIAYTYDHGTTPTYRIHALDLSTLADVVTPAIVSASGTLAHGRTYKFNAAVSRQRPGLLLANGNVYAGFGSFCGAANNLSRGWVLGWQTGTLTPLTSNELTDKLGTSPDDFFLSSVWMAGYGLASGGPNGDVYFVTGNSDGGMAGGDGQVNNLGESVIQMSPDLSTVVSAFTPDDANSLDQGDTDFGSGGALLLPPQTGQVSDLLVAAGKEGNMFFLNGDNLDNNTTGSKRILGTYNIGNCWCGESYFQGSDGIGRVVSSGAYTMEIWKIATGSKPRLIQETAVAGNIANGAQDPGFFTSVSSNGTTANSAIVWAMSRADGTSNENVGLFAFDTVTGATLFTANAGTWPNVTGDADLVPVVANGKVFVGSFQQLAIFGLGVPGAAAKAPFAPYVATRLPLAPGEHEIYGTAHAVDGTAIVIQKRDGALVTVDATQARKDHNLAPVSVGHGVLARGTYNGSGVMAASIVLHAKDHTTAWLPDR